MVQSKVSDMSCLNPILIKRVLPSDDVEYCKVRCRTCEDCKQAARSAAYVRTYYEYENCMKAHGMAFFFTLTFADEYVPFKFRRMCFDKKLIQGWLQEFRQVFRRKYGYRLKYIIVSELGHVGTHRPHHHGELFLYPDTKYQLKSWQKGGKYHDKIPHFPVTFALLIKDLWKYGRCDISALDPEKGGTRYVTKYISKDVEEENLFKDIITRIQIKRGKGKPETSNEYYSKTFPALFSFMNRYLPFTMISKDFGLTDKITDENIEKETIIFIDGLPYNIPRYYSDRYIRREIKEAVQYSQHPLDFSDLKIKNKWCCLQWDYKLERNVLKPFYLDTPNLAVPTQRIIDKYTIKENPDDLFSKEIYYGPDYTIRYSYSGEPRLVRILPKQSEVSQLSNIRKQLRKDNIFSLIEDKYNSLPQILRDSCEYDIPKLLRESPRHFEINDPFYDIIVVTDYACNVLTHLDELVQTASEWRAKSRIMKREQARKDKMRMNVRHCKAPLKWVEYKQKSHYLQIKW